MDSNAPVISNWSELIQRLRQYAQAVSVLGGMNDLGKTL